MHSYRQPFPSEAMLQSLRAPRLGPAPPGRNPKTRKLKPYLEALRVLGVPYLEALRVLGVPYLEALRVLGVPYLEALRGS